MHDENKMAKIAILFCPKWLINPGEKSRPISHTNDTYIIAGTIVDDFKIT